MGNLKQGSHVLDVGSGSGYLAACFAALVKPHQGKVYGIEHIPQLVDRSISNVMKDNAPFIQEGFLELKAGDGYQGYPSAAPFDAIHVGAAAPTIPNALITQLALGGRLVIPVGPAGGDQSLMVIDKVPDVSSPNGWALREESVEGVRYVPLTSVEGQLKGR